MVEDVLKQVILVLRIEWIEKTDPCGLNTILCCRTWANNFIPSVGDFIEFGDERERVTERRVICSDDFSDTCIEIEVLTSLSYVPSKDEIASFKHDGWKILYVDTWDKSYKDLEDKP